MASASAADERLRVTRAEGPGGVLLRLSGVVNEAFDRNALLRGGARATLLDLDAVHRITSFGVREWVAAMEGLTGAPCYLVRCRPSMVSQLNMVANFAGEGILISFYAPYACPACGAEAERLVDLTREHASISAHAAPPFPCPACGEPAELDDLPESYFEFAAAHPPPTLPPEVEALLTGVAPPGPLRISKEVVGRVTALTLSGALDGTSRLKRLADGLEGSAVFLLDQLTLVDAAGAAQLARLLTSTSARLFLARVPLHVAQALLATPSGLGRAQLVSVRLALTCGSCGADSAVELDAGQWAPFPTEGAVERGCPDCGELLSTDSEPAAFAAARALPLSPVPDEVRRYLEGPQQAVDLSSPPPLHWKRREATPVASASERMRQALGRFQLLRLLGVGGMAEVYLARQSGAGGFVKQVVVKRILPHLAADEAFVQMFLQEAKVAARISHPNVVQIFDLGQAGEEYFIAMEYVRGWDLAAVLRICARLSAPFPVELAARILAEVCAGLEAAHGSVDADGRQSPIVHRDVSPHNVLLSTDGQVKLTDFGIAKAVDNSQRTPTATLKGKLAYMSPEQIRADGTPVDARADLFAAGLILFQCLTLEHLFRRESEFATLKAILYDPIPRITLRRPEAPVELEAVVDRALARDPQERFPSAAAMQEALEGAIRATGRPAGLPDLRRWLTSVVGQADLLGHLPPDMAFTPTGNIPLEATQATAPTLVTGFVRRKAGGQEDPFDGG